jgi:Phage-related baseplate assembly protein
MSLIDLSQLPAPEVVENLDYETLYEELLADFRSAMGRAGPRRWSPIRWSSCWSWRPTASCCCAPASTTPRAP